MCATESITFANSGFGKLYKSTRYAVKLCSAAQLNSACDPQTCVKGAPPRVGTAKERGV